jgi:hypothetical protein
VSDTLADALSEALRETDGDALSDTVLEFECVLLTLADALGVALVDADGVTDGVAVVDVVPEDVFERV